ncbi:hypothetical protein [Paenibacillus ehimensis]|uniref:Uncharacterized protein n=1 Tax=Paenibacillus ehimensis TaxID=79264 RepID=A0ABT8VHZ4_9BACL|nr:hypothetical protein [Paenibacillus ehimensis]MDO3680585.1 hypothetical protein [Paenibacillus ehimensis]
MMSIALICCIGVGGVLACSLKLAVRWLKPLEIAAYYLFVTTVIELIYNILALNLKWVTVAPGPLPFWILEVTFLTITPAGYVWLFASYRLIARQSLRVLATIAFLAVLTLGELFYSQRGWIQFHHWPIWYSLIRWTAVWGAMAGFCLFFTNKLTAELSQ